MESLIEATIQFVKKTLETAETGHDWFHIERVYKVALTINKTEKADHLVVSLAALLHDIADSKFNNGDENVGPETAILFLKSIDVAPSIIDHVANIIKHMSFKNSFDKEVFSSIEMNVVQDADRLDALGAIGIARAFTYGGYKNRVLYDPNIKPETNHSKSSYKSSSSPTINHFYEKLLLLKDGMKTDAGKKMALERHNFMSAYLTQFYKEWDGN